MRKLKKQKLLFFSAIATLAITPMTAVSCLYRNNPTVEYANSFVQDNPYTQKEKITYTQDDLKIPALQAFENQFYNNELLTYSFTLYNYGLTKAISIDNDHLKRNLTKQVGKLYDFNKQGIEIKINQTNLDKIKDLKTDPDYDSLSKFISNAINRINQSYKEYVAYVNDYNAKDENKNKIKIRTLEQIANTNYNDIVNSTPEYLKKETVIHKDIDTISTTTYLDYSNPKLVIDDQKVEAVVKNFLIDTPFYQKYIRYQNDKDPEKRLLTKKEGKWTFNLSKNNEIFGAIPYSMFTSLYQEVKKRFGSITQAKKDTKKILEIFLNDFKERSFNVDLNQLINDNGIFLGFGPLNILYGKNINTDKQDDAFTIFARDYEFSPEQEEAFLKNPIQFFNSNLELLYLPEVFKIKRDLENQKSLLKVAKPNEVKKIEFLQKSIATYQNQLKTIEQHQQELIELANKRDEIVKSNDSNKETLLEQNMNQMIALAKKYFNSAYQKALTILKKAVAESKTNIQQLAKLYAVSIFGLGAFKTQIIKGYVTNNDVKKATYWIEFFDTKDNKWYMFDTLKSYLAQRPNIEQNIYPSSELSNYNFANELFTSLPANYELDENYLDVAHVK
ncbi:hypothetical protein GE118_00765 [Mycoplasma sp. NEAQ87857]|uniref:hypothetical protein n=1 Tax=Mycoplasma sp. NEAQ87857 TaxID=2683967 RepID=UPI00131707C1|nr:hypothetical protein [Mycoplasma sp. NEAQ87857]QGZ97333.1 hypothetical protein GE118_00765 [Mycoplasma sp. NEAQ87857]